MALKGKGPGDPPKKKKVTMTVAQKKRYDGIVKEQDAANVTYKKQPQNRASTKQFTDARKLRDHQLISLSRGETPPVPKPKASADAGRAKIKTAEKRMDAVKKFRSEKVSNSSVNKGITTEINNNIAEGKAMIAEMDRLVQEKKAASSTFRDKDHMKISSKMPKGN